MRSHFAVQRDVITYLSEFVDVEIEIVTRWQSKDLALVLEELLEQVALRVQSSLAIFVLVIIFRRRFA